MSFSVGSVWTVFSSDLQSHVDKDTRTRHMPSEVTLPSTGLPAPPAACLRLLAWSHPQTTFSLRPLQTISSPLDFACFHSRVFHHGVCGLGHGRFPGGCSRSHLSGPRAFPPASVHSTLPQERSVPNTHLTTAPSFPKLLPRQKPSMAQGS